MAERSTESFLKLVDEALRLTLEEMAFAVVIPLRIEQETEVTENLLYWSSLEILDPARGKVAILISEKLSKSLVSSIYGMFDEDEITDDHLKDASNEVLNTFGGKLCELLFGTDTLFNLGIPEYGRIKDKPDFLARDRERVIVEYAIEGCKLTVVIDASLLKNAS